MNANYGNRFFIEKDIKNCDFFKALPGNLDALVNPLYQRLQVMFDKYAQKKHQQLNPGTTPGIAMKSSRGNPEE